MGHSFGGQIALELAARRPDIVRRVVSLDGPVVAPWLPATHNERIAGARNISQQQPRALADPDAWEAFNRPGITDTRENMRHYGRFMATSTRVLVQYWREN